MREAFRRFAYAISSCVGSVWAFVAALGVVAAWAAAGPFLRYSEGWQLAINTITTIATFLMVFVIQTTQNRDARTMELKLDELIRAVDGARTRLVRLEDMSDEELDALRREFEQLQRRLSDDGGLARLERVAGRLASDRTADGAE